MIKVLQMFSKSKPKERIDTEQREQYEYARRRINQKKRLMRHFIVFLAGSILLIIINPVLGIGKDFFIKDWFVWAILIWALLFLVHVFNVFITNKFMGKEWEDRQMDKLKAKQEKRIAQLEQKLEKEAPVIEPTEVIETTSELIEPQDVKKKDSSQQPPPEEA